MDHFKSPAAKTGLVVDPVPLISVAWMNSRPHLPCCSYFSSIHCLLCFSPTRQYLGSLQMCLEPGSGPVACAAGDLQTQLRGPGTNEKNKSLEREIIFKGSAVT